VIPEEAKNAAGACWYSPVAGVAVQSAMNKNCES
jgi:hypothetical protein